MIPLMLPFWLVAVALAVLLLATQYITTVAFSENVDLSTKGKVATIADEHVRVTGDDLVIPELDQIIGAYALSATMARAQLVSPSLRKLLNPEIFPVEATATIDATGRGFNNWSKDPIPLIRGEKLNAEAVNTAAEQTTVLVWLADTKPLPVGGDIRTIRATIPTTTATYAWTNQVLTFDQTLPAGAYDVVGCALFATAALCGRLNFVGGAWRPGVLAHNLVEDNRPEIFRRGNLGVLGSFDFETPPTIDVLTTGATGASVVLLDLVQTREGR